MTTLPLCCKPISVSHPYCYTITHERQLFQVNEGEKTKVPLLLLLLANCC